MTDRSEVVGPVPEAWVATRVDEARDRLTASEGGRLLWQVVEAHGGLERWHRAGTLAFDFDYAPIGAPERRRYTRNHVDTWSARAWQEELGEGADATLGWDGDAAWIVPGPDAFPSPAAFWALTPYYFVGIPFVLADPGTTIERLPDETHPGGVWQRVRVRYDGGDRYELLVHPRTHRIEGLRYDVTWRGFHPDGGASPLKHMDWLSFHELDGLSIIRHIHTRRHDETTGEIGEITTDIQVSDLERGATWPTERFAPPEGAHIEPALP